MHKIALPKKPATSQDEKWINDLQTQVLNEKLERSIKNKDWFTDIRKVSETLNVSEKTLIDSGWFDYNQRLTVFGLEMIANTIHGHYGPVNMALSALEEFDGLRPDQRENARALYERVMSQEDAERSLFRREVSQHHGLDLKGVENRLNIRVFSPIFCNSDRELTEATFDKYLREGDRHFSNFCKFLEKNKTGPIRERKYLHFIAWFYDEALRKKWAASTVRSYRSALVTWLGIHCGLRSQAWLLEESLTRECLAYLGYDSEKIDKLLAKGKTRQKELGRRKAKTSAKPEKSISFEDFAEIELYLLHSSTHPLSKELAYLMLATLQTGIRPVEWKLTKVVLVHDEQGSETDFYEISLMNAKASNGRAPGATRTFALQGLSSEAVEAIIRTSRVGCEYADKGENAYRNFQRRCNELLQWVTKEVYLTHGHDEKIPRLTLYSLRHQFTANCKAKGLHWEETSAIMGHVDVYTAIENYGRTKVGWHPSQTQGEITAKNRNLVRVQNHTDLKAKHDPRYTKIAEAREDLPLPVPVLKPKFL